MVQPGGPEAEQCSEARAGDHQKKPESNGSYGALFLQAGVVGDRLGDNGAEISSNHDPEERVGDEAQRRPSRFV